MIDGVDVDLVVVVDVDVDVVDVMVDDVELSGIPC